MDVIFWNSPPDGDFFSRYIGPYKLVHWIKKHGIESQVIDFITKLSEEQLYQITKKFITTDTLVLGISTTFLTMKSHVDSEGKSSPFPPHILKTVIRLKSEYPKLKIVLGGYISDHLNMGGLVDAVVMSYTNPVEDIFLEYVNHYKLGTPLPFGQLQSSLREERKKFTRARMMYDTARNPKYHIEQDDFKWGPRDCILDRESLPLDVSRGCIFKCRFCQYPHLGKNKYDYVRRMEHIKEELIDNYNNFNTTNYMILDDTFNDTEFKMQAFNDMVASLPFKINYTAYLRADLIDRFPNTAYLLKDSGLWGAFFGLESLHPYASNLVGKAWSGKQAKEKIPNLVHNIWNSEIPITSSFIVGLPKETKQDLWNTLNWWKQNNLHSIAFHKLGIINVNANSRYSVFSEFDLNLEKYGFRFEEKIWVNETWNEDDALAFSTQIQRHALSNNKMTIWNLGNLLALGYTKEQLMTILIKDFDMPSIRELNRARYEEYFLKLSQL